MSYNNAQLLALAQNAPEDLAKMLNNQNIDIKLLTNGIEILSEETKDESLILPLFQNLLKHTNALVREGAIAGVAAFYENRQLPHNIIERLKIISNNDPSCDLKSYAKDILNDI